MNPDPLQLPETAWMFERERAYYEHYERRLRRRRRVSLILAVLIVVIAALFATQVAASRRGPEASRIRPVALAAGTTDRQTLSGALRPVTSTAAEDNSVPLHLADLLGVTGQASWYCSSTSRCTRGYPASGLFAAAGPALRKGDWRGSAVRVCAGGDCVTVRLIDWCACPGRVIDLYRSAFAQLASPSRGVIRVTVSDSSIALPPTDTVR